MKPACSIERLVRGLMGLAWTQLVWSELAEILRALMELAANELAWTQLAWKEQRVEKTINVRDYQYNSSGKLTFGAGGP